MARARIRILHLYDQYLNIYADRGNITVLRERCRRREIECDVDGMAPGERFEPGEYDLIYVGGGQDRDQRMIAERMVEDVAEPLAAAVDGDTALLAVCGGYQLLGEYYLDASGVRQPGTGVFDLRTEAGQTRMIGNEAIEAHLPAIGDRPALEALVVGFENHAGRTLLGDSATPLGRVIAGYGNDGESGYEGCTSRRAIGTYLHGPLLPRNPEIADWLISAALAHAQGEEAAALVTPLDDTLANRAREVALSRARDERRIRAR